MLLRVIQWRGMFARFWSFNPARTHARSFFTFVVDDFTRQKKKSQEERLRSSRTAGFRHRQEAMSRRAGRVGEARRPRCLPATATATALVSFCFFLPVTVDARWPCMLTRFWPYFHAYRVRQTYHDQHDIRRTKKRLFPTKN